MSIVEEVGAEVTDTINGPLAEARAITLGAQEKLEGVIADLRKISQKTGSEHVRGTIGNLAVGSTQLDEAKTQMEGAVEELRTYLSACLGLKGAAERPSPNDGSGPAPTPTKTPESIPRIRLCGKGILPQEVRNKNQRYREGGQVESKPERIGTTAPLDENQKQALLRRPPSYGTRLIDEWRSWLNPEEAEVIEAKLKEFLATVNADRERSGLGKIRPESIVIGYGHYEPTYDELRCVTDWHTDNRVTPTVRYIQTVLGPATQFAEGNIAHKDTYMNRLNDQQSVRDGGPLRLVEHAVGAVTRFFSGYVPHRAPNAAGVRLIFTCDVPVLPPPSDG